MPLAQSGSGITNRASNVDKDTEQQIGEVFSMLDRKISEISRAKGLFTAQVRLLQPLHKCVFVGDIDIFVALDVHDLGGISRNQFEDWSGKPMNMATATFLVERDLGFTKTFGFQFPRAVLEYETDRKDGGVTKIAERLLEEELMEIERQERIVRLNPIFQGRDFLLDDQLIFVLSPFQEPFNTIYQDHIKPSIESIQGLRCLRADDIYDNRPIIEDIWRYINQAQILVAELTGRNANVFYETGIAHTVGKEVILITQAMNDVPFDLKHLRCIVYEHTPRGSNTLEQNLKNTVANVLSRRN